MISAALQQLACDISQSFLTIIGLVQQKIRSIDAQPIELSVLQDLQLLLSQTETALASMNDACEAVEDGVDDSSQPIAIEGPNSSQPIEETL